MRIQARDGLLCLPGTKDQTGRPEQAPLKNNGRGGRAVDPMGCFIFTENGI